MLQGEYVDFFLRCGGTYLERDAVPVVSDEQIAYAQQLEWNRRDGGRPIIWLTYG